MTIVIRPSDLYYKYPRKKATRAVPKFCGKPDPHPFDRDDLYEVIPLLAAVMDALGSDDARLLQRLEEVMLLEMPRCLVSREEVFDCLLAIGSDLLDDRL